MLERRYSIYWNRMYTGWCVAVNGDPYATKKYYDTQKKAFAAAGRLARDYAKRNNMFARQHGSSWLVEFHKTDSPYVENFKGFSWEA